jgi:FAD synthase
MIMRKKALENCNFVVNQKLGDKHLSVSELKNKINDGDNSIAKKVLYFGSSLRGTTQYWSQRGNSCLYQYADTPKAGDMTFLK